MKVKKIILIVTAMVMSFSMTACGTHAANSSIEESSVVQKENTGAAVIKVESNLYGSANTNGYTTLKAEEDVHEVSYDESTEAVMSISTEDGSAVDDSLIDTSNAYVELDEGDGYYLDDLIFNGTKLNADFENGQLTYHLKEGDIEWKNPSDYDVDNGGLEWSCLGGNGNGEYTFNLSVHGITYDGVEIEPVSFRAIVYIYGREFAASNSPDNPGESAKWGVGGYDSVELPLPEVTPLTEDVKVDTEPVWTWVGQNTYGKPIICDYSHKEEQQVGTAGQQSGQDNQQSDSTYYDATDNFYISWPEGVDASALENGDVTITLKSNYGDEYVLTPNTGLKTVKENGEQIADGEYSVFAKADVTQVAINMVYWAYTPVYTTMTIDVNTDKLDGYDSDVSYTTDIGSVYTYMVQMGGGLDRAGTVAVQSVFGVANIDDLQLSDLAGQPTSYDYAYSEGEGMDSKAVAFLIDNGDGTYTVTEDEKEATKYDSDTKPALIGHNVFTTAYDDTVKAEYNGQTCEFSKNYDGFTMLNVPDLSNTKLEAADGYVLSQAMMWSEHMRWPWLYFTGCGWTASKNE